MTQSLLGKTAIVTGAAGNGMGRSIALTLAREGANVVVNYLTNEDSAAAIVRHVESQGGAAVACRADVTRQDQCKALVDAATEKFRQVEICVIGPGAGWHQEPVDRLDSAAALDDAQKELAPIYHLLPLVLPGMYERKWGRVIAIALTPPYNSPAYAYNVAKAARGGDAHCPRRDLAARRYRQHRRAGAGACAEESRRRRRAVRARACVAESPHGVPSGHRRRSRLPLLRVRQLHLRSDAAVQVSMIQGKGRRFRCRN